MQDPTPFSRSARPGRRLLPQALLLAALLGAGLAQAQPVQVWQTSGDGRQLLAAQPDKALAPAPEGAARGALITVDAGQRYQRMAGFGASITDASAELIQRKLKPEQRQALIAELFGRDQGGLGFSFTRLTIGASDFSSRHYSLADLPPGRTDPDLGRDFSLDKQRDDVLPVVRAALAVNPQLQIMATPWSAPAWMKTSNSLVQGRLKPEMYGAFSDYLVRYVEAMGAEGVPIFALSVQNEPHFEPDNYPGMRVSPHERAELIGRHLGPLLQQRGLGQLRILDWDHNWDQPQSPLVVLADPVARPYVAGVAWHCYAGDVAAQSRVREAHPDKEVWFTECSGGNWAPRWGESMSWMMKQLIIGSTRHWARGVLMWNLALDENHGPHLGGCGDCRGVVTIDSRTGAITRNVEYAVFGHASRFVRPGAERIDSGALRPDLDHVAFRNADDGSRVLIVSNASRRAQRFTVREGGRQFSHQLPAHGVVTFVWPEPAAPR